MQKSFDRRKSGLQDAAEDEASRRCLLFKSFGKDKQSSDRRIASCTMGSMMMQMERGWKRRSEQRRLGGTAGLGRTTFRFLHFPFARCFIDMQLHRDTLATCRYLYPRDVCLVSLVAT